MRNKQPLSFPGFSSPQALAIPARNSGVLHVSPTRPLIYNYNDKDAQVPVRPRQQEKAQVSPKWSLRRPVQLPLPNLSSARSVIVESIVEGIDGLMAMIAHKMDKDAAPNPLLEGMYAPQPMEALVSDANVSGVIPGDLHGLFATVQPNPQFPTIVPSQYHIFEGDSSVLTVRIRKGDERVSFAYTHLETEKRAYERSLRRSTVLSVASMRGYSGFALLLLALLRKNLTKDIYDASLANTNIEQHGGKLFSLMDTFKAYELGPSKDGSALQITRKADFGEYQGSFAAHPLAHPSNGCLYSVSYCWQERTRDAVVTVLDSNAKFLRSFPITLGRKPMMHSSAITEKYVIILDFSVLLSPEEMFKKNGSVVKYHSDKTSRIGLLPVDAVDDSGILWFDIPAASCFHTINAYDTEDGVVLHLCRMKEFDVMKSVDFPASLRLVRYDINVANSSISWKLEPIPIMMELPYVNKQVFGKRAKYAFGSIIVRNADGTARNSGIAKYDLENSCLVGTIKFQGVGLGESIFNMKEKARHESDGYLSAYIRDTNGNTSMNIFDANTMSSEPLARVHGPEAFHIPAFAFHSQHVSAETLDSFETG